MPQLKASTDMTLKRALALIGLSTFATAFAADLAVATDLKGDPVIRKQESYPSIPVPAPIPVPEAFNWYLRADVGYIFAANTPSFTETGYSTAALNYPTAAYTNTLSSDSDGGWNNYGTIGAGVGYQFSKWLRGDLTVEVRNQATHNFRGTYTYNSLAVLPLLPRPIQVDVEDSIKQKNYVGLANVYVDIPVHTYFTPYIGFGIGLVAHDTNRKYSETQTDNSVLPGVQVFTGTNKSRETSYDLALALMAGTTIDISTGTSIDLGYRFLHLQGAEIANSRPINAAAIDLIQGGGTGLKIGDQNIHEVRAGLRWKIW